jgi:hypothetical protein
MDYRRATYSSRICLNQMTRDEALEQLKAQPYDDAKVQEDKKYVAKKLGISIGELDTYLKAAPKTYVDFPNNKKLIEDCYAFYNKHFNSKRV